MRLFLLLLLAATALAQDKAFFLALDKQWSDAIVKSDTAALEKLLAPGLVYAHATGIIDTKTSYIAKIKERRQVYKSFEQRNPIVNIYTDAAVTFSHVRVTGTNQAGPSGRASRAQSAQAIDEGASPGASMAPASGGTSTAITSGWEPLPKCAAKSSWHSAHAGL